MQKSLELAWADRLMRYVPLWCKSNYSFLQGSSHPEELIEEAKRLGLPAIAITDIDGVYGIVRAHVKARELGIHLIVGSEIVFEDDSKVILLVQDRVGYANLCQLISRGRLRCPKGKSRLVIQDVCDFSKGIIALWDPWPTSLSGNEIPHFSDVQGMKSAFLGRLYVRIARHLQAEEIKHEMRLRVFANENQLPCVATNEVLYHCRERRDLHDVLTCIHYGLTLATAGQKTKSNAEHVLRSAEQMFQLYEDTVEDVQRSYEVAKQCHFSLNKLRYRYPAEKVPSGLNVHQHLYELCQKGMHLRYEGNVPKQVEEQLYKELALIEELDYGGYFLTMHEVVMFCQKQKILCQGRGSAANSIVCYVLQITAVDPVKMGLLFERFISRERAEPPDIDLDIEHERREEVIQFVYEKYGRDRAAMVANVIRYRIRSAMRDVAKVLGISSVAIDRMAKLVGYHGQPSKEVFGQCGLDPGHPVCAHFVRIVAEICDFPRHLSIHPGGFLLGHEPVAEIVPIENATMDQRTVVQWDKDDIEALGLFKVDLLGLGALSHLRRCFDLIQESQGERWSLASLPQDDEACYDMICQADTVGVFQIESRAQMSMLPRLRPRNYYDLVIEVSIVRPGPISGGMVHPYLRRRRGEEEVCYPHESLIPVLRKTLGVPLFQEQVMRLAMVAADYTPGEADQLRRDMAAWKKSGRIENHRHRLISRMQRKGISREFSERVFDQIRGFGEYGFPESHAASFAWVAYATSWLKCHYHSEFTCALLNSQPMGFYTPSTIIEDAKRHGVTVLPIDLCVSEWDCTLELSQKIGQETEQKIEQKLAQESGKGHHWAVRIGLRYVKGLQYERVREVLHIRKQKKFSSLDDCLRRTRLDRKSQLNLAQAGAFNSLIRSRRQSLWEIHGFQVTQSDRLSWKVNENSNWFSELSDTETVMWDYARCSLSTRGHPLEVLREMLEQRGYPTAAEVNRQRHCAYVDYVGAVICRQRPGTAGGVTFMTLEDETGFVNIVVWSSIFEKYHTLIRTIDLLGVSGKIQSEDHVVHLIADRFWQPQLHRPLTTAKSRNFH